MLPYCTKTDCAKAYGKARLMAGIHALMLTLLFVAIADAGARASIQVTFDLHNQDKVADVVRIEAHVKSAVQIDQVQFYVDDQLQKTVTGIPYQFSWDTIHTTEGPHTIKAVATDDNGDVGTGVLQLTVDNQLSLGAAALADKAQKALSTDDMDGAKRWARRAEKAEKDFLPAEKVLAALDAANLHFHAAAARLQKAKDLAQSITAQQMLATYQMHMALIANYQAEFVSLAQSALKLNTRAADLKIARINADSQISSTQKSIQTGDLYLKTDRPQQASTAYLPATTGANASHSAVVRLALAYVANRQFSDAQHMLDIYRIKKQDDAAMRAVYALALVMQHKTAEAETLLHNDLKNNIPASQVVGSYIALQQGRKGEAARLAQTALTALPLAPDASFALTMATADQLTARKTLRTALLLAPQQPGPYLIYAAQIALLNKVHNYVLGEKIAAFASTLLPSAISPRILNALMLTVVHNFDGAKPILNGLYLRFPTYPDLAVAMSAYANDINLGGPASRYLTAAHHLDPALYSIQIPPSASQTILTLYLQMHYRPCFFLTLSTLFPHTVQAAGGN